MQNKTKIFLILLMLLLLFYLLIPVNSFSKLDSIIRRAIMIAYMNGYADALTLKIEDIKKLKSNDSLLKKKVKSEASDYIFTVEKMN